MVRIHARLLVRLARATGLAALTLTVAGCGGENGQGLKDAGKYAGLNEYEARSEAQQVVYKESGDESSPAHGRPLTVLNSSHDAFEDGTPAWRIEFMTLDETPAGVCAWVGQAEHTPLRETIEYVVDHC